MVDGVRIPEDRPGASEGRSERLRREGAAVPQLAASLRRLAALTPAQRAVLARIGSAGEPLTAARLAEDSGVRSSSVREILETLLDAGFVRRERMPVVGPGRPSYGYVALGPTGVDGPIAMFLDIVNATVETLRELNPDPVEASRSIGEAWARRLVGDAVPDHGMHPPSAYDALDLVAHLDKIAFLYSALGFDAVAGRGTAIGLRSCPFMRGGGVDPLICEIHRGMTRRLIDMTSQGRAQGELRPWVTPTVCEVALTEK